jgi:hypothetical protein
MATGSFDYKLDFAYNKTNRINWFWQ